MGFGMLFGGYLYGNFIPQSPFIISLGATFMALLMVVFLIHEPKKRVGETTPA